MIFYDWFLDGKVFTKPEHSTLNLNKTYTTSHPSLIGVGRNYKTSITTNIIYLLQIKNSMPIYLLHVFQPSIMKNQLNLLPHYLLSVTIDLFFVPKVLRTLFSRLSSEEKLEKGSIH